MNPNRHDPRRRGYALIELMVTLTVLAVLLGLGAGALHLLVRLDRASRDALDLASDQARLGSAWRGDVHAATADPPPSVAAERLTLNLPEQGQVVYSIRADDLVREVRQGDRVKQREVYRRPPRASVRFEALAVADRPFLALVVRQEPALTRDPTAATEPAARIEAEVGRVARWAGRTP